MSIDIIRLQIETPWSTCIANVWPTPLQFSSLTYKSWEVLTSDGKCFCIEKPRNNWISASEADPQLVRAIGNLIDRWASVTSIKRNNNKDMLLELKLDESAG